MMRLNSLIHGRGIYLIALFAGFLQAWAFDFSFDFQPHWLPSLLSFVAIVIFLWGLLPLSPKKAALFAYLFALAYFGWGLDWVYISMARFGGASLAFAVLANIAVIAYLSLYWLLCGFLISLFGKSHNQKLLLAAPIIVFFEWVRTVFLIGFPWLSIGYAWVDNPLAIFASVGGVLGVSFLAIGLAATTLLKIQLRYKIALLLLLCAVGLLPQWLIRPQNPTTVKVALVQGNIPVITQYNRKIMDRSLRQYQSITTNLLKKNKDIQVVIWPETAIPYFYRDALGFLDTIKQQQQQYGFDLISGIPKINLLKRQYLNAIILQKPTTPKKQFYYKYHLLPFGEYIPFRHLLAIFKRFVTIPMADFSPGPLVQPPFRVGGVRFSPSICFEIVFGNQIRQNASHSSVLLNISNDAWFGRSKAQSQHLNIARMRAIENQKPLIRTTNNGLTAVVNKRGKVTQSLPPFTSGYLLAEVTHNDEQTIYARFGDVSLLIFCILSFIGITLFPKIKHLKSRNAIK